MEDTPSGILSRGTSIRWKRLSRLRKKWVPPLSSAAGDHDERGVVQRRGHGEPGVCGAVLAEKSGVPAALLLNEAVTFDQVMHGIEYGFNAVMLDSSDLPFDENVEITRKVVETAHAAGVDVEAELGHRPMGSGNNDGKSRLTDPDQAAEFISRMGMDALAVSIGNIHVLLKSKSDKLNLDLLERIHEKVDIPLVIHGSTGFQMMPFQGPSSSGWRNSTSARCSKRLSGPA